VFCPWTDGNKQESLTVFTHRLSNSPGWWTPTAKAVVRIALGLRFAHGGLKASNVLFDPERRIENGRRRTVLGRRVGADSGRFPHFPLFFLRSRLVEDGWSLESNRNLSFVDIVARLKEKCFEITAGADSDEVSAFVSWVESPERGGERQ
jgi:hypothetical protein